MSGDLHRKKPDFRKKLQEVPHQPGVYLMRDRFDRVIYVGKARDLRKRLSNYFTPSRQTLSNIKTRALIQSIWNFDLHVVRNETESLLLEVKLIKEFRPRYNVSFRDDKRFLLLKVHPEDAFPRFELSRVRKDDGARYFGPFAHSGALRHTMEWVTRRFGLRACQPLVPGEADYRHCSDDIIRNCAAPCMGKITSKEYRVRVDQACQLLEGKSRELLDDLETQMQRAAGELQFEKAAELRDILDNLRKTLSPARRFTRRPGLPEAPADHALEAVEELQQILHLEVPPLVMECFDISNISTTHCVASMVPFTNGRSDKSQYRRYRIQTVSGQNDFASMAEVIRRRYTRVLQQVAEDIPETAESQESPEEIIQRLTQTEGQTKTGARLADLIIVDGGKGQLSSARKELHRLGLHHVPIIGLAKEHEEIYRPDIPDPLILSHDLAALKLLQRIRDEAHRFANGYHQLLMKRRIGESLLDDCPGISERRKLALLKKFGSVARLRKASPDEIALLPGFSRQSAETILNFLETH